MTEKVLEVKNLKVDFTTLNGTVHAIRDVSFDLNKGETLALVGESGSGKSVTVRSVIQLYAKNAIVTDGNIKFHGQDLLSLTPKEMDKIRGKDISMIFQDPMTSLDPTMTIGRQVAEPLLIHHEANPKAAMRRAKEVLELVGIPNAANRLEDYPHQFSGGQRQRIVIAMAIIDNPEILIADEPTTALDVTVQAQIIKLLKELQQKIGTSIIFITHDLGVVAGIADRVAVMYAGKIIEYGKTDEIYYDPKHPYTWGLLDSMPTLDIKGKRLKAIPGTPANLINPPKGDAFAPRNKYALSIDERLQPPYFKVTDTHYAATWLLDSRAPKVVPPASIQKRQQKYNPKGGKKMIKEKDERKVAVKVRHLKQYFNVGKKDEVHAVDDVSFDIYEGETLGLVGESGSGKTTTGRSIIRLYDPTAGKIEFEGHNIAKLKHRELKDFRKNLQMIFQDPYASLEPRMKVKDIIAEGIDIHGLAKNSEDRDRQVRNLLKQVNLNPEFANRYPHEFSGGQRQRIGIARALAVQPSFIIADEPISALDVSIQAQVVNLLQDIQEEKGLTYLFIAHDLSMVKYISDRIAVLYKGKIVELSDTEEVYNNPLHPYTKSLLSAVPIPDPELEKNHEHITFDHSNPFKEGEELREVLPGHFLFCDETTAKSFKK